MISPIYTFDFMCPGCRTRQTIKEKYDENKVYVCSSCNWTGIIPLQNRLRTTKLHPYTFQCPYCKGIQRTYDVDNKGEIDGYEVMECDCPECGKHIVHKHETISHWLQRTRK